MRLARGADGAHPSVSPFVAGFGALLFLAAGGLGLRAFAFHEELQVLRLLSVVIIVASCALSFLTSRNHVQVWRNHYFRAVLAMLAIPLLCTLLVGTLQLGQPWVDILKLNIFFFSYLVFPTLLFWAGCSRRALVSLNSVLVGFGLITAILQITASHFPALGDILLNETVLAPTRFDTSNHRVLSSSVSGLGAIYATLYCFVRLASRQRSAFVSWFLVASAILLLYYHIYVLQGRRTMLVLVFVVLVIVALQYRADRRLVAVASLIVAFGIWICASGSNPLNVLAASIQSSYEESLEDNTSVGIRLQGMDYFWYEFRRTGNLGFGAVSPQRCADTDLGFAMSTYNPNDHGIFAVLFQYGFQGILLTILVVRRMISDLRHGWHSRLDDIRSISVSVSYLLVFNIVGLQQMFLFSDQAIWWSAFFYLTWGCAGVAQADATPKDCAIETGYASGAAHCNKKGATRATRSWPDALAILAYARVSSRAE